MLPILRLRLLPQTGGRGITERSLNNYARLNSLMKFIGKESRHHWLFRFEQSVDRYGHRMGKLAFGTGQSGRLW
jgi:hypothetical protein